VFHVLIWGGLELCLGAKPPKAPRGDGTGQHYRTFTEASASLTSM